MASLFSRRTAAIYLRIQGTLVVGWWLLLLLSPEERARFKAADHPDSALLAFWLGDLVIVAAGSLLAAHWLVRGSPRAAGTLWFLSGGISFGTLYCVALSMLTGQALVGCVLMVPAALVTLSIAGQHAKP
ncbi:MAG: hypothetical protein U0625_13395 [Phycisphaerales bacterium]